MKYYYKILLIALFCINVASIYSRDMTYMIPDIGTPGMGVYVEFIAPHDKNNYFGSDGFYLNNNDGSENISVFPALGQKYSNSVIIGPCVVSWNGRLLSTHIFVNPDVIPNSTEWDKLNDDFKINLIVKTGTNEISYDYYILKPNPPQSLKNDTLGSAKNGKRSPRGALLFESLILDGANTVSTDDCDPNTPGNQGFLPIVILAKKSIIGINNAVLSVNGGSRSTSKSGRGDGGPGGGGGGGQWKDDLLDNDGTDGGFGFSGAGKGGTNHIVSGGYFKSTGTGTFLGLKNNDSVGYSLNGVAPPNQNPLNYESAGGSTGHPFGLSGENCGDRNSYLPNQQYGYGGALGVRDNEDGSGAGYASVGKGKKYTDSGNDYFTFGKIHGNKMIIPIAGGSGGGSGNPCTLPYYPVGGAGGGGGGALRIYAPIIKDLKLTANGGDGENRNRDGGGGSGGAIEVSAKYSSSNISFSVLGGNDKDNNRGGGYGYCRMDAFKYNDIITDPSDILYSGIALDTTSFVKSQDTLKGKCPEKGQYSLYKKIGSNAWYKTSLKSEDMFPEFALIQNFNPNKDFEYYVLVREDAGSGTGSNSSNYEQKYLLSQAAANLLQPLESNFSCPDVVEEEFICYSETAKHIFNINVDVFGDKVTFDFTKSKFQNNDTRFTLIDPISIIGIEANKSMTIQIMFKPDINFTIADTNVFELYHDCPKKPNPYLIKLKIDTVAVLDLALVNTNNCGTIKIGKKVNHSLIYENKGNVSIKILNIPVVQPPFTYIGSNPDTSKVLKPGDQIDFNFEFEPTVEGESKVFSSKIDYMQVPTNKCTSSIEPIIIGSGALTNISYPTKIDSLFSWCDSIYIEVPIANLGSATDIFNVIEEPTIEGKDKGEFELIEEGTRPYPFPINGSNGTIYKINKTPNQREFGNFEFEFVFKTDIKGQEIIRIPVTVYIDKLDIKPDQIPINFGNVSVGFETKKRLFNFTNKGKLKLHIIEEKVTDPTAILKRTTGNEYVSTDEKNDYELYYKPMTEGKSDFYVRIVFDEPCLDRFDILVTATGILSEITLPDTIDFGVHPSCTKGELRDIEYRNDSEAPYIILQGSELILENSEGLFSSMVTALSKIPNVHDTIWKSIDPTPAMQIIFDSKTKLHGKYYAKYTAKVYQNGEIKDVFVVLKVEIDSGRVELIDSPPKFPKITAKKTTTQKVIFTNLSSWDVTIVDVVSPTKQEFVILPPDNINKVLKTGASAEFNIQFKPLIDGIYNDKIVIKYNVDICANQKEIPLGAEASKARTINLFIPDTLKVDPWLNNYKIPIYIKINDDEEELTNYGLDSVSIEFNRTLLYPKSITKGKFIDNPNEMYHGNNRLLTFKIDDVNLTRNKSILTEINFSTMLGDTNETEITLNNIKLSDSSEVSDTKLFNGKLQINTCKDGGERLIINTGLKPELSVSPNPAKNIVNANVQMIEKGDYFLIIIDMTGKPTDIKSWNKPNGGIETVDIPINLDSYPNGNYIIQVNMPSMILSKDLIISK